MFDPYLYISPYLQRVKKFKASSKYTKTFTKFTSTNPYLYQTYFYITQQTILASSIHFLRDRVKAFY
jgi:hypothetical protein